MHRLIALAGLALICAMPVSADTKDEEIALLREQIRLLSARLDRIEQNGQSSSSPTQNTVAASQPISDLASIEQLVDQKVDERFADSWTDRISWKGDFRYRYENIGIEDREDRNRQRIRARAHLEARVNESTKVGLGMASGGDDPVSTNQTLGGGGSTKGLNLDLAYFQWEGLENTSIVGGKFKNLLHRAGGNGLLWDGDWNPEGTGIRWDNGRFFVTGLGTWVESDSNASRQEFSYGVQAGATWALSDGMELVAGAGYYRFDTAGAGSFYGDDDDFFGNSFDPESLTYLYDYHEIEAFAELNFDLLGRPSSVFADYVVNTAADENDTGYAFGFAHGSASAPGTWEMGVIYQDLEADSVLGLLTDSDFGGGGTNVKGFILNGAYAFMKNWNASFTYFINDIGINSGNPRDFDRLQLDLNFKYK